MVYQLVSLAIAGSGPHVEVTDDGGVRGRVEVFAAPEVVSAMLQRPPALYGITQPDAHLQVRPDPDPACHEVEVVAPHPLLPTTFVARDCWTGAGLTTELVSSPQLSEMRGAWVVEPYGDHSVVEYRLKVQLSGPFPDFVVRASTKRSVAKVLRSMEAAFRP